MHELGTRAYTANQETRNPTTDVKNVKIFHKRTAISDKTIENYYRSITLLKCGIRISHYHFKISSFPVECRMTLRYSGFEYFKSDAKFKFCPSYTAQYGISIPQFHPDNRVFLKVTIREKQKIRNSRHTTQRITLSLYMLRGNSSKCKRALSSVIEFFSLL